jgi:hypothetical protein
VSSTQGIRSLKLLFSRVLRLAAAGLLCFGLGRGLAAQEATATPPLQSPTQADPGAQKDVAGFEDVGTVGVAGPIEASRRDVLLGLAQWDHTLLGAFQLGERILHLTAELPAIRISAPPDRPRDAIGHFRTNGGHMTMNDLAHAWKMDQLQRGGMNVDMKSPYGNFRVTYRELFNGRTTNALGGGIGQASAAAMYTTPRFGTGGLLDFSAAALMGSGSINQLMGGGFGNNNIGGFGPHLHKAEGPTVALKLTF